MEHVIQQKGKFYFTQVVSPRHPCATKSKKTEDVQNVTWNVRSLFAEGKWANVTYKMINLKVDVLDISDGQDQENAQETMESTIIQVTMKQIIVIV